jgi:hypothetical protein
MDAIRKRMITFKQFLEETIKSPTRKQLLEGGNAIKTSSRINQLNVAATLKSIYSDLLPKLGLKKSDTTLLGSTGKKDPNKNGTEQGSSGDIDLGISMKALMAANNLKDKGEVFDFLTKVGKDYSDCKAFPGLDVVSVGYPIENKDGEQEGKIVQLDLMPVDNLKYAAWSYYSPSFDESKYKALYPKEIYYACARFADTKVKETGKNDDGEDVPATWDRLFFDLGKGLMSGTQSIKGKKKLTKGAKTTDKKVLSTDPQEIVNKFFGPKFKPDDVLTWEQVWKVIHSDDFILKDKLPEILALAKKGIVRKGYPVPPELEKEVE